MHGELLGFLTPWLYSLFGRFGFEQSYWHKGQVRRLLSQAILTSPLGIRAMIEGVASRCTVCWARRPHPCPALR